MPVRLRKSVVLRRALHLLLLFASIILITAASFRLQSYLFALKVQSIVSRMGQIQLDKASQAEVVALLPELKPGVLWSFPINHEEYQKCPGDACYSLLIQNVPNGLVFKLREKLNNGHDWIFRVAYWLGHRYRNFRVYVEIRDGRVSSYEYGLAVSDDEYPLGGLVDLQVLGADRASFPGYFGFMSDYDEIRGFRIRIPNNRWTRTMYVAFTPEADPKDVKNAFDIHLECIWNAEGCSADKQLLPLLWEQKIEPGSRK